METIKNVMEGYLIISILVGVVTIGISTWICYKMGDSLLHGGRSLILIVVIALISAFLVSVSLKPLFFYVFEIKDEWLAHLLGGVLSIIANFISAVTRSSKILKGVRGVQG